MRKLLPPALFISFLVISFSVNSQDACSNISCDCADLPLDAWKTICKKKENRIVSTCMENNKLAPQGFCSIHGPEANRIPLSINLDKSVIVAESEIIRLNYRIAILYWSLHKDLDLLQQSVNKDAWNSSFNYLKLIDNNANTLFDTQKQVTSSLLAANAEAESQKSWRDYSTDTLKVGNMLFDYGRAMLSAAEAQENAKMKSDTHNLAFQILEVSSRLYEQAGYAYANGVRHTLAAKTWKEAATISETLMRAGNNVTKSNWYRQQTAMRLHKASYYHMLGQGHNETAISDAEKLLESGEEYSAN